MFTIIITYLTADIKYAFLNIKPDVWSAFFIIAFIICAIWFAKTFFSFLKNYKYEGIDCIINNLKKGE